MFLPYTVDVPMQRYPIVNWALIAVTIAVSVTIFFSPQAGPSPTIYPDVPPELRSVFEPNRPGWYTLVLQRDHFQVHQLVSHAFVHAGIVHLLGNMLFLFCFGNAVNAKLGQLGYLAAYLLFAVVAGLAWLAFGTASGAVDASGAIMGVVGVFLIYFPRNDVYVLYFYAFFYVVKYGGFTLSAYWLILAYVAFDVWGVLSKDMEGIAYISHVAGAAGGIALAVALLLTRLVQSTDTEQNLLQLLRIRK